MLLPLVPLIVAPLMPLMPLESLESLASLISLTPLVPRTPRPLLAYIPREAISTYSSSTSNYGRSRRILGLRRAVPLLRY